MKLNMHAMWLAQVSAASGLASALVECDRCGIEVPDDPLYFTDDNPAWSGLCMACCHELDGTTLHLQESPVVARILLELRTAPVSLNIASLAHRTNLSRKTVSRWLHDLEYAGVVHGQRERNNCFYRCTDQIEQASLFSLDEFILQ